MEDGDALELIRAQHATGGSLVTPAGEFAKATLALALGKSEEQARDDHGRFASGGGSDTRAAARGKYKDTKGVAAARQLKINDVIAGRGQYAGLSAKDRQLKINDIEAGRDDAN